MSQEFINGNIQPLGQAVTDSSTFLLVLDPSGFPQTFPFRILVDAEQMDVTAIFPPLGGDFHQLIVDRGVNGTTAASHAVDVDIIELIPNCPAADDLTLTVSASANKSSPATTVDSVVLGNSAASNISRNLETANSLVLSDTANTNARLIGSSNDTLTLSDSANSGLVRQETATSIISLAGIATSSVSRSRSSQDTLNLNDQAGAKLTHLATANSSLTLSDSAAVDNHLIVEQTLELSDIAQVVNQLSNTITLSDVATIVRDGQRSAEDDLEISHAVAYTLIREKTDEQFSPFVGSSTQQGVPDPIDVTEPSLTPGNVQLAFPVNSPTTTLELRAPVFGNRDRLSAQRINRLTRGGELKIYADPQWPNNHTLVMEFTALTDQQVEAYLQFVATTLGKEIKLTDHEGRDWQGVLTVPDEPVVRNSRKNNSASLVFEGELV